MPRYEVQLNETLVHTVEVEAEDWHQALEKAYEIVMNLPEDNYITESIGTTDRSVVEID